MEMEINAPGLIRTFVMMQGAACMLFVDDHSIETGETEQDEQYCQNDDAKRKGNMNLKASFCQQQPDPHRDNQEFSPRPFRIIVGGQIALPSPGYNRSINSQKISARRPQRSSSRRKA